MNRNFIFASLVMAIAVNISIIGCHRKSDYPRANGRDSARAVTTPDTNSVQQPVNNPYQNSIIEIKTYKNDPPMGGFGYDLYIDHDLKVHQPHVPAVSGNKGFSTEEKARRAGEFVGSKFKNNIMPPSVNAAELDSLGVLDTAFQRLSPR